MGIGRLALRVTVGGLMLGHGLQKLNGSFGGGGLEGTETMMAAIGMHPAKHQARAVALSETVGGGLTAAGMLSPLGPAIITGVMAVAIEKVHRKKGLWVTSGGFEYNLLLAAAALAIASEGPGLLSVDGILRKQRSGSLWALGELALGVAGAAAALAIAERMAPGEGASPATTESEQAAAAPAGVPSPTEPSPSPAR